MKRYLLPKEGNFYKANMHCHTEISDGRYSPSEIKKQYMEHGFSVVAYTDHDAFILHNDLSDENFLALNGYEVEINEESDKIWHMRKTCHVNFVALRPDLEQAVCWHRSDYLFGNAPKYRHLVKFDENEPDYVRTYTPECISDMMTRARNAGFFVTYNHPSWSQETLEQYGKYHGMHALEICNYGCVVAGYPDYCEKEYDEILRGGERIFCNAGDDYHGGAKDYCGNPMQSGFGAFTMIKAEKLEYNAVADALKNGHFYASQGPEIYELWYEDGYIHMKCSPVAEIRCNTAYRVVNVLRSEDETQPLTEAVFDVHDDHGYERITITDFRGKHANTNAYFVDDLLGLSKRES